MGIIFKPGVNLREIFQDPEKRKLTGEAITAYLRDGFYDTENNPIPSKPKFSAETIIQFPLAELKKLLAGEYISAGDITGGAAVGIQRKEVFIADVPADTQYLLIFRTVQSNKAGETYETAAAGITFTQLKLGEAPKLGTITQTANYVPNLKWGAAFGFHREWIEDNEVWKLEDLIRQAKIGAYDAKATYMYGLIVAANWSNINYATSWVNSLNLAFAALKKNKALLPNQRPVILCPVEKLAEILQAVKDTLVTGQRGERLTVIPDIIDSTYILDANKKVYVLVPFERFILQEREALRTETDKDIMLDAEAYAWYFRMNGVILDTKYGVTITYS
uniref:Phage major capsid protein n=1 Tax=candidate division WOR-3 bacterium TaxID=2052148 RepID=A0A7C6E9Q1_UNCW3